VKQLVLEILPPPLPSFANFVVGQNAEAVSALRAAAHDGTPQRVIYLWGPTSCGKSHLLMAFAEAARAIRLSELWASLQDQALDERKLAVDDVDRLPDRLQIALFDAINRRSLSPTSTVVAVGSVAPRDLPLRPELSSRLGSGLVFKVHDLSDDEKATALQAHADSRGFSLPTELINYLLRHARRDMGSLIATLDALDKFSLEEGREITLPLLKQMSQPSLI